MYDQNPFDAPPEGEEFYDGPIVQPIPDNLMIGDYIEIDGICRGPEVSIELVTEAQQMTGRNDILPLQIRMLAGGPVLVKNYSKDKVNQQQYNHRLGLQRDLAFSLCIYALEEGYEIKLNGETVCIHKHVVKLEDVAAITMDGDADFQSIEFKDTTGGDGDMEYIADTPKQGFMRVQEMRESLSRKPGSATFVRSSIRRSSKRANHTSTATAQPTEWKTSSDLSNPAIEFDTRNRHTYAPESQYMAVDVPVAPVPYSTGGYQGSINEPSPKKKMGALGGRKSINLEDAKFDESRIVGGAQSRTIAGDSHTGAYRELDDDVRMSATQISNTMYAGSHGDLSASVSSLPDKKKKRSSIFDRFRKSKGSEPDLSDIGKDRNKKNKGSKTFIRTSMGSSSILENELQKSPIGSSTMSLRSGNLSTGFDYSPVPGPIPKSIIKLDAPQMSAYVAGQKATPEFEAFTLTNMEYPIAIGATRSSAKPDVHVTNAVDSVRAVPQPAVSVAPSMKQSVYLGVGTDLAYVPGPVPKSIQKSPAPQIAGYMAGQKAVPDFENFKLVESTWTPQARGTNLDVNQGPPVPALATPRELKGKAPEKADILYEAGRASFDPNVNLTGGILEPAVRVSAIEGTYVDPRTEVKPPKLKGSAPEMASTVNTYYENVLPGETTLTDPTVSRQLPVSEIRSTSGDAVVSYTKPGKLKGPAPELAAQLADTHQGRMSIVSDTTLAGDISQQKQRTTVINRPTHDIDNVINRPVYTERHVEQQVKPVIKVSPPEVRRSSSEFYPRYSKDDDSESLVHSDGEYSIIVGRSTYFLERQRSLRGYKSKRSRGKERQTRVSMGLQDRTDSQRSSISSLTESELMQFKKSQAYWSKQDIREKPVYSTKVTTSTVYAEPPQPQSVLPPVTKNFVDATDLRKSRFKAEFPIPLNSGRAAHLVGHFLHEASSPQSCTVQFSTDTLTEANAFTALAFEIWSTGALTVHGTRKSNPSQLIKWQPDKVVNNLRDLRNFKISLHARGLYSAVSIDDYVTIPLPGVSDLSHLNFVELVDPTHAELSHFAITANLSLPVDLIFPEQSHREETQILMLKTKMTADTERVSATFVTQTQQVFTVLFDFKQYKVFVQTATNTESPLIHKEIPFVPEQMSEILIKQMANENDLTISANGIELLSQPLSLARPVGKLSRVQVDGQFVLLDARVR